MNANETQKSMIPDDTRHDPDRDCSRLVPSHARLHTGAVTTGSGYLSVAMAPTKNPHSAAPIHLTTLRTLYREGRQNYRLLFGTPVRTETRFATQGYTARTLSFLRGARFALDLWACNAYGTIQWRCFVCEAIGPGDIGDLVPHVRPAAKVLLHTKGAAQSRLFLGWLKELEASGVDPLTCPAETFEAAHFRLQGSRADKTSTRTLSGLA